MTQPTVLANRRQFVQGVGAAGAIAVAGCLDDSVRRPDASDVEPAAADRDDDEEHEDDGLPPAESPDIDHIAADPQALPPPVDWDEPERTSLHSRRSRPRSRSNSTTVRCRRWTSTSA